MLESQCRSFPGGVVAAAVWLPLVEPPPIQPLPQNARVEPQLSPANAELLANATARLEAFFAQMEAQGVAVDAVAAAARRRRVLASDSPSGSGAEGAAAAGGAAAGAAGGGLCSLRLLLVVELVADEQMAAIMPINSIRNAAFLAVDTPLAAMVDVDLSISAGLAGRVLSNASRVGELLSRAQSQQRTAWVLPTFDVHRNVSRGEKSAAVEEALAVPLEEKTTKLQAMWRDRHRIHPFAADRYALGHNATDYDRWFSGLEEYPSGFQEGYEPWFMAAREAMPPYDVRIRGRYHDKITNVRHAMKMLTFMVAPDVWLVHRPHGLSPSHLGYRNSRAAGTWALEKSFQRDGKTSPAAELYLKADQRFFGDVIRRTNDGSYQPVVDETWRHCRAALPWWRHVSSSSSSSSNFPLEHTLPPPPTLGSSSSSSSSSSSAAAAAAA
ncbi:hypothetical protein PLESTF_001711500 [Pleodorina starrii]|nr:hypothetical protein PLESTM_000718800 [Pleodorina starrii]GLC75958.1 hypothetical protein PLESTF_001711500 [Pleodorina starrii]